MKIKEGDLISIEWLDACDRDISKEDIGILLKDLTDGRELLEINTTYGKLIKIMKEVVILATEESVISDTECVIIPKGWIIEPKELIKK